MEANELRIGNLIYAPSGVEKYVFGTRYKTILYTAHLEDPTYGEAYDYQCEPIPLTEQWLLKFGFELIKNQCYGFKNRLFFISDSKIYDYGSDTLIEYVHKLQNFIFALTNQELEIKM